LCSCFLGAYPAILTFYSPALILIFLNILTFSRILRTIYRSKNCHPYKETKLNVSNSNTTAQHFLVSSNTVRNRIPSNPHPRITPHHQFIDSASLPFASPTNSFTVSLSHYQSIQIILVVGVMYIGDVMIWTFAALVLWTEGSWIFVTTYALTSVLFSILAIVVYFKFIDQSKTTNSRMNKMIRAIYYKDSTKTFEKKTEVKFTNTMVILTTGFKNDALSSIRSSTPLYHEAVKSTEDCKSVHDHVLSVHDLAESYKSKVGTSKGKPLCCDNSRVVSTESLGHDSLSECNNRRLTNTSNCCLYSDCDSLPFSSSSLPISSLSSSLLHSYKCSAQGLNCATPHTTPVNASLLSSICSFSMSTPNTVYSRSGFPSYAGKLEAEVSSLSDDSSVVQCLEERLYDFDGQSSSDDDHSMYSVSKTVEEQSERYTYNNTRPQCETSFCEKSYENPSVSDKTHSCERCVYVHNRRSSIFIDVPPHRTCHCLDFDQLPSVSGSVKSTCYSAKKNEHTPYLKSPKFYGLPEKGVNSCTNRGIYTCMHHNSDTRPCDSSSYISSGVINQDCHCFPPERSMSPLNNCQCSTCHCNYFPASRCCGTSFRNSCVSTHPCRRTQVIQQHLNSFCLCRCNEVPQYHACNCSEPPIYRHWQQNHCFCVKCLNSEAEVNRTCHPDRATKADFFLADSDKLASKDRLLQSCCYERNYSDEVIYSSRATGNLFRNQISKHSDVRRNRVEFDRNMGHGGTHCSDAVKLRHINSIDTDIASSLSESEDELCPVRLRRENIHYNSPVL